MSKIRLLAIAAIATASVTSASGALAAPATSGHHASSQGARFSTQLHYTFDEGEKLTDGSLVTNVGHPDFPGRVKTAFSGQLTMVAGLVGHGAGFPRTCSTCGRGIIEASDRPGLDPGKRDLSFGVAVKATALQGQGSANLIQKGLYNEVGGQYKLQTEDGVPSCVILGSRGRLLVQSKSSIADGTWHTVSCTRIGTRVTLRVDGQTVRQLRGQTGLISNAAPVRVGGLALIRANDQYHGNMDSVYVRIKR
jgi:hypothetical protein